MKSRVLHAAIGGSFFLCAAQTVQATLFTASGTYDEQAFQANQVDQNYDGNAVSNTSVFDNVGNMSAALPSAFLAGRGGVLNFDLPNGLTPTVAGANGIIDVAFGGGKSLRITSTANVDYGILGGSTPISGTAADSKSMFLSSSATTWTLNIGPITGGQSGEYVSRLGFTLLSRASTAENVTVKFVADDVTRTATAIPSSGSTATGDIYFGGNGTNLTQVVITFSGTQSDKRLAIDDLAFITAVPEPGTLGLAAVVSLGLLWRRRRTV